MDGFIQDVRFAVRALALSPGLLLSAALSLAIGVAANTTIFSAVDVFLYRPLPYPDQDRLVQVWSANETRGWDQTSISLPDYFDWRERSRTIELAAYSATSVSVSGGEQPERVQSARVAWNLFNLLGIQPERGRAFRSDEEPTGADNAIIISNALLQRRFAGDPGIIGQTVTVDGVPRAIVGVMAEDFEFPSRAVDLWLPLGHTGQERRDNRSIHVIGRVRPNASVEAARAELVSIARQLESEYPAENQGMSTRVVTLKQELFGEVFVTASMICTVAVAFVLLIACANIANLLLARAAARDREMAVRTVLGAERWMILRQLLVESMVLAFVGGTAGLLLSFVGIRWLVAMFPPWFAFASRIGVDARVLAFTLMITILSGILFGLAPALQAARPDLSQSLREAGGRGSTLGSRRGRFRSGLVVAEVGLALALLIAAGLLVRSYIGIQRVDLGFNPERVVTARVSLLPSKYPDSVAVADFAARFRAKLGDVAEFEAVGATSVVPMAGGSGTYYTIDGEAPADPAQRPVAQFRAITPGYLEAMDIRLLSGRDFRDQDRIDSHAVMLVNRSFAERHWPGDEAIGKRVELSSGIREIVGVVADTRDFGPEDDPPATMYIPALQRTARELTWVVRSDLDPGAAASRLRSEVAALDPELPLFQLSTMAAVIERSMAGDTIMVRLLSVFAAFALVLAVLGVYGVMAYNVTQRTQEMGIRMALGAQRADIVRMIVRQGARLAAIGVAGGLLVALATARFLSAFLHGVSPFDLLTFVAVPLALGGAALAAAFIPARRATRIDPIEALRYE
jgi:putative ABC transport system permease protein